MTDEQKAEEIASKILSKDEQSESYSVMVQALMDMACWKDAELLKKLQQEASNLSKKLLRVDYPYTRCP